MATRKRIYASLLLVLLLVVITALFSSCNTLPDLDIDYELESDYFDTVSNYSTYNEDGSLDIKLTSVSALSIFSYTYSFTVYDAEMDVIYATNKQTVIEEIDAEEEFSINISIPKDIAEQYSYHKLDLSGVSREAPFKLVARTYTVTYVCDGEVYKTEEVRGGGTISTIEGKDYDNLRFDGWYKDESLSLSAGIYDRIYRNKTYYAKYSLDAEKVTNKLTTELMSGLISIHCTKNGVYSSSSAGSGIIFKKDSNGYYYALTNAHVLSSSTVYAIDCYGNSKKAQIIAKNEEYDLGVITFVSSEPLKIYSFADSNPGVSKNCISLGYPNLQKNAITYGSVEKYEPIEFEKLNFEVIRHSAIVTHGCSGGPLLNSDLEIAGINFAKANDGIEFTTGYAVPIEKVKEFLNLNGISY